jgi:PAS domain S-box-containing protein
MAPGQVHVSADPTPSRDDVRRDERSDFLSRVVSPARFDVLFEYLPDVSFFVKDGAGRFVCVNRGFVQLVRAASEDAVLGARDSDFFPPDLADAYARDDQEVMSQGEPIVDKAELVRHADGNVTWYCTTKLPLLDKDGRVIGVCGLTRDMSRMHLSDASFACWAPVIETMLREYATALETPTLAQRAALSISQFNRQFRKRFRTTPHAYLSNIRLSAACHFLVTTELSMAQIALKTGFYDQSHFTNRFVKARGMPPSRYRALHARSVAGRLESCARRARVFSDEASGVYMLQGGAQS